MTHRLLVADSLLYVRRDQHVGVIYYDNINWTSNYYDAGDNQFDSQCVGRVISDICDCVLACVFTCPLSKRKAT